jgi:hypothetical protein
MQKKKSVMAIEFNLVLMVFLLVILFQAIKMPYGTLHAPGAGFLPVWTASIAFVILGYITVREFDLNPKHYDFKFKKFSVAEIRAKIKEQKLVLFTLGLLLYIPLFRYINVDLANFVVSIYLMKVNNVKGWVKPLLFSGILTIVLWLCFTVWLRIQFPRTIF